MSWLGIRNHRSLRFGLRLVALIGGIVAAFVASALMELGLFWWSTFALTPVLATAFLDFLIVEVLAVRAFPYATEQKLIRMEKRLGADAIHKISNRLQQAIDKFPACDQARVSATIHVIVEIAALSDLQIHEGLLQLTDYVGPDGGQKGRITPINQGVIGRCARTQVLEHVDFADAAEYSNRMVKEFGFTSSQAERHTKTGRSYLAYPIKSEDKFIGVLYFFTTEPQVFPAVANTADLEEVTREVVNYMTLADLV